MISLFNNISFQIVIAQTGARGVRDVALFLFPSCTDSVKQSLQFSCNFIVFNASDGSLFPDIYPQFVICTLGVIKISPLCTFQVKIWFQNRRTKWKKHENITATEIPEHKLQAAKNPDVAKAIQNAAKLRKAKERLELSNSNTNKKDSLNQPLDFSMESLGKTKNTHEDFTERIREQKNYEREDGSIKSEENEEAEKDDGAEDECIENDIVNDESNHVTGDSDRISDIQIEDTGRPTSQSYENIEDINNDKNDDDISETNNDSVKLTVYKEQYPDSTVIS
jgi:hypothetical protein